MPTGKFVITDGPNHERLFDSLRLADEKRVVHFEWTDGVKCAPEAIVLSVSAVGKNPSGNDWIVMGYLLLPWTDNSFRAVYNTQSKHGEIELHVRDTLLAAVTL